jgi:hypothetical protein
MPDLPVMIDIFDHAGYHRCVWSPVYVQTSFVRTRFCSLQYMITLIPPS